MENKKYAKKVWREKWGDSCVNRPFHHWSIYGWVGPSNRCTLPSLFWEPLCCPSPFFKIIFFGISSTVQVSTEQKSSLILRNWIICCWSVNQDHQRLHVQTEFSNLLSLISELLRLHCIVICKRSSRICASGHHKIDATISALVGCHLSLWIWWGLKVWMGDN